MQILTLSYSVTLPFQSTALTLGTVTVLHTEVRLRFAKYFTTVVANLAVVVIGALHLLALVYNNNIFSFCTQTEQDYFNYLFSFFRILLTTWPRNGSLK